MYVSFFIFWKETLSMAIGLKTQRKTDVFWNVIVDMNRQVVMLSDTIAAQRNGTTIFLLVKKVKTLAKYM